MKKNALQVLSESGINWERNLKSMVHIEEPLFLAKDVAEWIGHSQVSKMLDAVDDEEKLMGTLFLSGQKKKSMDCKRRMAFMRSLCKAGNL